MRLIDVQQEFDQLAHRASALGFGLEAKTHSRIEDALFHVTYVVTKDDVIVLHTEDVVILKAYVQLLEFVAVTN